MFVHIYDSTAIYRAVILVAVLMVGLSFSQRGIGQENTPVATPAAGTGFESGSFTLQPDALIVLQESGRAELASRAEAARANVAPTAASDEQVISPTLTPSHPLRWIGGGIVALLLVVRQVRSSRRSAKRSRQWYKTQGERTKISSKHMGEIRKIAGRMPAVAVPDEEAVSIFRMRPTVNPENRTPLGGFTSRQRRTDVY